MAACHGREAVGLRAGARGKLPFIPTASLALSDNGSCWLGLLDG